MKKTLKQWYARLEARSLAKLTPEERVDVLAADAAFQKRLGRNLGLFALSWLVTALVVKTLVPGMGWPGTFGVAALVLVSLTLALTGAWFGPSRFKMGVRGVLLLLGVTVIGALVGGLSANIAKRGSLAGVLNDFSAIAPKILFGGLVAGLVYAVLMVSIVQYRRNQLQRRNEQLERQATQERMGRQIADSRLKLLQAQVEPHFLFNTLASVQQLAEGKAPEAARLTAQLIAFLRGGLASLREDTTTLGRDFQAMEAYLAIMQTRMPERLQYSVDLPCELKDIPMPPAMLVSLVENAIKHGLEPSLEGGRIDVMAAREGQRLRITVTDTGQGPNIAKSGGGVGLDNIRQRLRVLFSDQASLTVSPNYPHGFIATIDMPLPENLDKEARK